jgi:TIR domain
MVSPQIFLSYSHRDEHYLQSLLPFLSTLERDGLVVVWSDKQIRPGERWREEIDAALHAATIAVLLVSQDFLASTFVRDEELPRILTRQQEGHLIVLPVFLRPSTITSYSILIHDSSGGERRIELREFQGFGSPDKTLAELDGPARERRFVDLHDRIRRLATGQLDVPPPVRPPQPGPQQQDVAARRPRISRIPFSRNRTFTGREEHLARLHRELQSGKAAAVTQALAGLGGIGKTQLALEYSYRFAREYDVVWWIRAEHPSTSRDDMRALGEALGIDAVDDSSLMIEATLEWLDHHEDWLLVFDNAEHPNQIRSLLPKAGRGRTLITSRYPGWGEVAEVVRLGVWTPEEAIGYLSRRASPPAGAAAAAIADMLGYLPLALAQAAAYVEETGSGFDGYLALLKSRPTETLKLRGNSSDAEKAVATVWDISFARVSESNASAVELLNLFAFLPPDRIPRALLGQRAEKLPPSIRATVEEPFAMDAAIGALRKYSLVETTPEAFSVHRLVQAVVRARLDNDTYRLLSEIAKDLEGDASSLSGHEDLPEPIKSRRAAYLVGGAVLAAALIVFAAQATRGIRSGAADRPEGIAKGAGSGSAGAHSSADAPSAYGPAKSRANPPIANGADLSFDGIASNGTSLPPDPQGAVGPHHYVQTAGGAFAVYDKAGKELLNPMFITALWTGRGDLCEKGSAVGGAVVYDHLADRWLLSYIAVDQSHVAEHEPQACLAVSKTDNPQENVWHLYTFTIGSRKEFVDYPRLAVWADGYYLSAGIFAENQFTGSDVWVFEREPMLRGNTAQFRRIHGSAGGFLFPAQLAGEPLAGSAELFVQQVSGKPPDKDRLEVFVCRIDWSAPVRSTLTLIATLEIQSFAAADCDCVPQPGTPTLLQVIGDRLMSPVQYRKFGDVEALVANHTINVGSKDRFAAGNRWYELKKASGGAWSIVQQGTSSADGVHRWMASIAMDAQENIALGYSASSKTLQPEIRYDARLRGDRPGEISIRDTILFRGRGSQTDISRWGGFSSMSPDPVGACTFWYTGEYLPYDGNYNWRTRIARFRLPGCAERPVTETRH